MIIYTLINHASRRALGISEAEYCLLDLVYKYATNPNSRVPGWCYASKPEIAKEREISERGLYKMASRLQGAGLLQTHPQTGHWRTTSKWFEAVIMVAKSQENTPEQSAVDPLNKVQLTPEQSAGNKSNDKSKEIRVIDIPSHTPASEREAAEIETFEAEIFEEKKFSGGPETSLAAEQRKAIEGCQAWCDENPEQVRWWRDTARFRGDLGPVIAGFFSHWWGERDKTHQCRTAPTDFFQTRFLKWLQTEERMQQNHTGYANNGSTDRSSGTQTRKPARANGAEDAFNPAAVAAVLRERHGVDVGSR